MYNNYIMLEKTLDKKYIFALDIIRTFAIICVICVHFFFNTNFYQDNINSFSWVYCFILRTLFVIGVPLFLTLSGYLLFDKKPNKNYYKKLFYIIGIYLIASVFTAFWNVFILGETFYLNDFIKKILEFKYIGYGWYVNMYIGLFFMAPFFNILWKNLENKNQKAGLILTLFAVALLPTILVKPYQLPNYWIDFFPVFFYFLGNWLREFKLNISSIKMLLILCVLVFGFGIINFLYCYGYSCKLIKHIIDSGCFQSGMVSFFVFSLFLKINYENWHGYIKKIIAIIAKHAYSIYLCSYMADKTVYKYLNSHITSSMPDKLIYFIPTVLCVFFISFILAYFTEKLYLILKFIIILIKSKRGLHEQ